MTLRLSLSGLRANFRFFLQDFQLEPAVNWPDVALSTVVVHEGVPPPVT